MSATPLNVARSTDIYDYLNWFSQYVRTNQAQGLAGTNFQPNYVLGQSNILDITDSVTLNGNMESQSNTIDITDSVSVTNYPDTIGSAVIGFSVIG